MSRRPITVAAVVIVLLTMVAVLGVGAGRDAAEAGTLSPAVDTTPVGVPVQGDPPTAAEPTRPSTLPRTTETPPKNGSAGATSAGSNGSTTAPGSTVAAPTATATAPADYDRDGIPDDRDVCPTRPETMNGFQDGDGCPDVVATTRAS